MKTLTQDEQDTIQRMEELGHLDPNCPSCRKFYEEGPNIMAPSHKANPECESGKHPHCTCDMCW